MPPPTYGQQRLLYFHYVPTSHYNTGIFLHCTNTEYLTDYDKISGGNHYQQ